MADDNARRWTDDTLDRVERVIGDARVDVGSIGQAGNVLGVLADAGLLVPPESEVVEQWRVKWRDIDSNEVRVTAVVRDRKEADRQLADLSEVWGHHARLILNKVIETPWTIVPGYGFAAPPSGGANGVRELMRDGAVRIVERLRIGHVRVWDGKCRECAYAYPCPTITSIESVEPWATLARDGAAAAMGLTSDAPEPPPPDAPPDLLTPDEHKAG